MMFVFCCDCLLLRPFVSYTLKIKRLHFNPFEIKMYHKMIEDYVTARNCDLGGKQILLQLLRINLQ